MVTHIGTSETIPQIVITPNKGLSRAGAAEQNAKPVIENRSPAEIRKNLSELASKQKSGTESHHVEGNGFWGTDGFTFGDLIDIINPLQHIPIVSTIYRALTGDEIGAGPRMIGGALLGGVTGFAASALSAAIEDQTGKDMGDQVLTALGLADDAEVSIAAKQAQETGATLLSSADTQSDIDWDAEEAIAKKAQSDAAYELAQQQMPNGIHIDPTASAEAMQAAELQAGLDPISLEPPVSAGNNDRAIFALGGLESATQRYQQTQMLDKLQTTALGMDIKG